MRLNTKKVLRTGINFNNFALSAPVTFITNAPFIFSIEIPGLNDDARVCLVYFGLLFEDKKFK